MARLADLVAAGEVQPPRWLIIAPKDVPGWRQSLASALDRCQVVVVDDMAGLFYATEDPEAWEVGADFLDVAPPFPLMWMECRRPSGLPRGVAEAPGGWDTLPPSWGWLFEAADVGHLAGQQRTVSPQEVEEVRRAIRANWLLYGGEIDAAVAAHGEAAREHVPHSLRHYYDIRQELADLDAGKPIFYPAEQKWDVRATLFLEGAGHLAVGPQYRLDLLLDDQGSVLRYVGGPIFSQGAPNPPPRELARAGLDLAKPMLLAISLLRCPEAALRNHVPPARLSRAHEKRHGRPPFRYRTLDIGNVRAILRREGRSDEVGLRQALATCRDRFAGAQPAPQSPAD